MNEAVVRSDTSCKCTALVIKQAKTVTYDLRIEGLWKGPDFVKMILCTVLFTPTWSNNGPGVNRSNGY